MSREDFRADMHESSVESLARMRKGIDELNETLQQNLCHSRVFCVSEVHDNVVMWSHYAEVHAGVVFKLRCLDELDNSLLAAMPVEYTEQFLRWPSAESYATHLTGEAPIERLVWRLATTKHSHWAYESEWRVHIPLLNEPAGDGYLYYEEHPSGL